MKMFVLSSRTSVSSDIPVLKEIINSHEEVFILHSYTIDIDECKRIYGNKLPLDGYPLMPYIYTNKNIFLFFISSKVTSGLEIITKNKKIIKPYELFPELSDDFWRKFITSCISKEDTEDSFKLKIAYMNPG